MRRAAALTEGGGLLPWYLHSRNYMARISVLKISEKGVFEGCDRERVRWTCGLIMRSVHWQVGLMDPPD